MALGYDELVAVLGCLPQAQRLCCSSVSTQFRRAATTASSHSITVRADAISSSSFQGWLQQHGQAVKGMHILPITSSNGWQQALPTNMLQQLPNLSSLTLGSSIKVSSAFWQQLPGLVRLTQLSISVYHIITIQDYSSTMQRLRC